MRGHLQEEGIEPEHGPPVMKALEAVFRGASKPGLVDCLIHARAVQAGGELYTFEKAARRLPRM